MHPKLIDTLSKYSTIILVGWGTGGHIQPILSLASELERKKLLWIGWKDSNEEIEAKKANISFKGISILKLTTTRSPKILLYPFFLLLGIFDTKVILNSIIKEYKENQMWGLQNEEIMRLLTVPWWKEKICVFSKWWPWSVAIGIAASSLWIPLFIHESDTIPGRSNRILGKLATRIFLGFECAKQYFNPEKCEIIGQILGASFVKEVPEGRRISRENQNKISPTTLYKEGINWKTDKTHILVICGSQGSQVIFREILGSFQNHDTYEWIIALGKLNEWMKKDFENMKNTQALEWISQEDIASLLGNTQIAITRGSATTLAEIDIFGVKKIIIPLPYSAENHQYWNAREYAKKWDILLEQKNLDQLHQIIQNIWQSSQH